MPSRDVRETIRWLKSPIIRLPMMVHFASSTLTTIQPRQVSARHRHQNRLNPGKKRSQNQPSGNACSACRTRNRAKNPAKGGRVEGVYDSTLKAPTIDADVAAGGSSQRSLILSMKRLKASIYGGPVQKRLIARLVISSDCGASPVNKLTKANTLSVSACADRLRLSIRYSIRRSSENWLRLTSKASVKPSV